MKTIRVYQLNHLAPMLFHRLKEAQADEQNDVFVTNDIKRPAR